MKKSERRSMQQALSVDSDVAEMQQLVIYFPKEAV